jgi:hypothetical protein
MLKQLIKNLKILTVGKTKRVKRPEISLDANLDKGKARIKRDKKVALMFTWRF